MPLILERSGTQYVAMVAELLSSNCGADFVESYSKESNITICSCTGQNIQLKMLKNRPSEGGTGMLLK